MVVLLLHRSMELYQSYSVRVVSACLLVCRCRSVGAGNSLVEEGLVALDHENLGSHYFVEGTEVWRCDWGAGQLDCRVENQLIQGLIEVQNEGAVLEIEN